MKAFEAGSPATNALAAWRSATEKNSNLLKSMASAITVMPQPIVGPSIKAIASYAPDRAYTSLADFPRLEAPASDETLVQAVVVLTAMRDEWATNAAVERADRAKSERYMHRWTWINAFLFAGTLIAAIATWLS